MTSIIGNRAVAVSPTVVALATIVLIISAVDVTGQMTDDEHRGVVELHNRLRRSVHPEAANMNQLTESASLRVLAQRAADTCVFEHNYGGEYAGKGENLYQGGSNTSQAVMLWFIERENYKFSAATCNLASGNGRYPQYASTCGHYYQVVQSGVIEIGCGLKACSGNHLFVCEYNVGAGSPLYTAGSACSRCSAAYPRCLNGLCVATGTAGSTCALECNSCNKLVGAGSASTDSCSCSGTHSPCNKCDSDATPCLNNGTDIGMSSSNCTCSCLPDYYGNQCEYNRAQFASAIQLRFGGELRSRSYFPVPKSFWPSLWRALEAPLLGALSDFCRSNFIVCCPRASGVATAAANSSFLATGDLRIVASGINVTATGELAVSLAAAAPATDAFCGYNSSRSAYASLSSPALIGYLSSRREQLAQATTACCGVNLTLVTSGLDQADYWPQGMGAGGGGEGSGGGDSGSGIAGGTAAGEQLNSVGTALLVIVSVCTVAATIAAVAHRLVSESAPRIVSQGAQQKDKPQAANAAEQSTTSQRPPPQNTVETFVEKL